MNIEVVSTGSGYKLTASVLIYTDAEARQAFATKHDVEEIQGRPTIRPGSPFTDLDYLALVKALEPAQRPGMQWNDSRVLAHGMGRTIWWAQPMQRILFFRKSTHNSSTFDGKGVCPSPGLVFLATDKALYVYAFKGAGAPTPETKLYQAPFFNVWSRGQVCHGSAAAPDAERAGDLDAWERMFFGSYFTHPNFTEKDRLTVGCNPVAFWQQQVERPDTVFPENVLFDIGLTVNDLMQPDLRTRLETVAQAEGEF